MQNEKLKQKLEQVAVKNGIHSMEWLGGSLYVRFQGSLPIIKADRTHIELRKIMKADETGVNMYSVGDEWVYDFVPLYAEVPLSHSAQELELYIDEGVGQIPQEVDVQLELEAEMARGK